VGKRWYVHVRRQLVTHWRLAVLISYVAIASILSSIGHSPPRAAMVAATALCTGQIANANK